MPGITSVGALFFMIAKKNNWPINDKNFLEPALVGLFAPDILKELLGGKKEDINIGRRRSHFAGGEVRYPKFDEFKEYVNNPELFDAKDIGDNSRYIIVDPKINMGEFLNKTSWLYEQDSKSIAFMIGLDTALKIDSIWDYTVQQQRMKFDKRISKIIYRENDSIKECNASKPRSMLNKLYPRLDKKLLEEAGLTETVFQGVRNILSKYYPEELLNNAFDKWWRIPSQKELENSESWKEENLQKAFPDNVLEYYKDECIEKISDINRIKNAVNKYLDKSSKENQNNNDSCLNLENDEFIH